MKNTLTFIVTIMKNIHCLVWLMFVLTLVGESSAQSVPLEETSQISDYETEYYHRLTTDLGNGPINGTLGEDNGYAARSRYEFQVNGYDLPQEISQWDFHIKLWLDLSTDNNNTPNIEGGTNEGVSLQLREFYFNKNFLFDDPRFSLSIGRKKIKDQYGLWWDESIESIIVNYDNTYNHAFFGIGQRLATYDTSGYELEPRNEGILYAFGEYNHDWSINHLSGIRYLYQNDNSSNKNNFNLFNFQGYQLGGYSQGQYYTDNYLLNYAIDFRVMNGKINRSLSQLNNLDNRIEGWSGFSEVGLTFNNISWSPKIGVIVASTNKPKAGEYGFIETNLQTNRINYKEGFSNGLVGSLVGIRFQNMKMYGLQLHLKPFVRTNIVASWYNVERRSQDNPLYPIIIPQDHISPIGSQVGTITELQSVWKSLPKRYHGRLFGFQTRMSLSYFSPDEATLNLDANYQIFFGIDLTY